LIAGLGLLLVWVILFVYLHSLSLPTYPIDKIKSLLVVFPHPDDEVLTCAGLIRLLSNKKIPVHILFLTKGEKGTSDAHLNEQLKEIRSQEALRAAALLGATVTIEDLGDGTLASKRTEIREVLEQNITNHQPTHVITYDLSGLYGHDDHIALAEELTKLIQSGYSNIKIIYASFPERILKKLNLPVHMATNNSYETYRLFPTHKVFIGRSILAKIHSLYAHKSQYHSFRSGFPVSWMPIGAWTSLGVLEYFHEKNLEGVPINRGVDVY
jgi:LmbE family N-acetylglucosaminyl deacetylase